MDVLKNAPQLLGVGHSKQTEQEATLGSNLEALLGPHSSTKYKAGHSTSGDSDLMPQVVAIVF